MILVHDHAFLRLVRCNATMSNAGTPGDSVKLKGGFVYGGKDSSITIIASAFNEMQAQDIYHT